MDPDFYQDCMAALETVIDPELGIDIVNLGLIYDLFYDGQGSLLVRMTLTTMGCPLQDIIMDSVDYAFKDMDRVERLKVDLVWVPAWTTDRLSRYARIALGIR
ncbi:aromatic ring hydroxylase [Aerococcus urinaehominis]|uniref:Aromatic ring hydroxylase n=1 Tax=Aerococcus urinaehominis TaxID=128944 RepID=A0A109RHA9_9LACT|nr:metal-sulfur cluster assembly factor [Aerococcus urinaehominis]AMC00030.1 aromatic ring hydroxylase [Aerococcus urinaehominis]